jgi:hypothetical protein
LTVDMPSWDIVERARMATAFVYQFKPAQGRRRYRAARHYWS